MRERLCTPQEATEASRIAKTQSLARVELDVEMVVHAGGRALVDDKDAARHTEVHDCSTVVRVYQQVLGAAIDRADRSTPQSVLDASRYGPPEPAVAHDDAPDCPIDEPGFDAAPARFDFGEFGHAVLKSAATIRVGV